MIKNNKRKLIISSLLILLPMIFGLIVWNKLPGQVTAHWGADGNADGFAGKGFVVFGLPIILLVFHWICLFITAKDNNGRWQSPKVMGMVFWIIPTVSLFTSCLIYATAFGKDWDVSSFTVIMIGTMFVVIGNYLPKCKQNFTMGIKVKWALANEENWNATHRFGGRLWVIGGLIILACVFLPEAASVFVLIAVLIPLAIAPMVYSYIYYKNQVKLGKAPEKVVVNMGSYSKKVMCAMLIVIAIVLIYLSAVVFTAKFEAIFDNDSFTIDATSWSDLTVEYSAVESVEYRDDVDIGVRTNGFGTPTISMGMFENEEFGTYTLYAYNGCKECVVIRVGEKVLVFGHKDTEITKEFYETVLEKTEK